MTPRWLHWPTSAASAWSPSDLADLFAWYKADAITGLTNNDPVSTWSDSSGNGYDVTASGSDRPTYKTNTLNSMPVVEFNATHWLAASTAADWKFLHDSTGSSVFVVFRYTRTDRMGLVWTAPYSSGTVGYTFGSDFSSKVNHVITRGVGGSFVAISVPGTPAINLVINADHVLGCVCDPSNATAADRSSLRLNGGAEAKVNTYTNAPSTANPYAPLTLGRVGNSGMDGLEGYIAEVVVCNAILSNSDREKVEGYLAHKWGLESNLPSTHPYKSIAP
jgi:hypothetical protein